MNLAQIKWRFTNICIKIIGSQICFGPHEQISPEQANVVIHFYLLILICLEKRFNNVWAFIWQWLQNHQLRCANSSIKRFFPPLSLVWPMRCYDILMPTLLWSITVHMCSLVSKSKQCEFKKLICFTIYAQPTGRGQAPLPISTTAMTNAMWWKHCIAMSGLLEGWLSIIQSSDHWIFMTNSHPASRS